MKKRIKAVFIYVLLSIPIANCQVGISTKTPNKSAVLDMTGVNNKGVLIPSVHLVTTTDTSGIAGGAPAQSLLVYNSNPAISGTGALGTGFYYWDNNTWKKMVTSSDASALGDNLGNHRATKTLRMANNTIDSIYQTNVLYQMGLTERTLADKSRNYQQYVTNGSYRIWTNKGGDRFTIDSTGNVGVGTMTPKKKFSVSGGPISQDDFADGDKYLLMGVSGGPKISHNNGWIFGSYAGQITDVNGTAVNNQTGIFNWYTANNGAWAVKMTLANDGSLSNTGTLKIGLIPASATTDSVLTADANGNVRKMAQGNIASNMMNIVSTSAATYTPTATDNVIIVDATNNSVTVSIPAATAATKGRYYTVKRIDNSANDVFIDFGSSHIDTATDTKLGVGNGVTIEFINLSNTQWYTITKF